MRGMASATALLRIDFSTSTQPQISNLPGQINRLFVDFDLILLHQLRQGKDTGCLFLSWKRSKQRMVRIFPHGTVFKGDVYEERNKHCRSVVREPDLLILSEFLSLADGLPRVMMGGCASHLYFSRVEGIERHLRRNHFFHREIAKDQNDVFMPGTARFKKASAL